MKTIGKMGWNFDMMFAWLRIILRSDYIKSKTPSEKNGQTD